MQAMISRIGAALTAAGLAMALAMVAWAPMRQDIPDPPAGASPQEVVTTYLAAVNARDFGTANRLALASTLQYGRLDSAPKVDQIQIGEPRPDDGTQGITLGTGFLESVFVPVSFVRKGRPADITTATGPAEWGYLLVRRTAESPWLIIDQGPV